MRKIYSLLIFALICSTQVVNAQSGSGEIRGMVSDSKTKEGIPFANVVVLLNGIQVGLGQTDFDGKYSVKPLNPGKYDVKVIILGYQTSLTKGVEVNGGRAQFADINLNSAAVEIKEVQIVEYRIPLIERDNTSVGGSLGKEDIKNISTRDVNSLVSTSAGVYQSDEGKGLSIKGSRDEGTVYFVDGVKVRNFSSLPKGALEQVTVITGGIPAQYGDVNGGVVSITSRGPSKDFSGGTEIVSSQITDNFGFNLLALNLAGPIFIKDKGTETERPLIGFAISAEGNYTADPNPSAVPIIKVKDSQRDAIAAHPLARGADGVIRPKSLFLRESDFEQIKTNENNFSKSINVTGKIEIQPLKNVTIAIGGNAQISDRMNYNFGNTLINTSGNSNTIQKNYNIYTRFTQRIGNASAETQTANSLKNVFYSIQLDYLKNSTTNQVKDNGLNIFNYGYVGKFNTFETETYEATNDYFVGNTRYHKMNVRSIDSITFDRQDVGRSNILANYTEDAYALNNSNPRSFDAFLGSGGLYNGIFPNSIYGLYGGIGGTRGGFSFTDNTQARVTGQLSGDFKNHSIQLGFEIEQRTDRFYGNSAAIGGGIWRYMDGKLNNQILFDESNPDSTVINNPNNDGSKLVYYKYKSNKNLQSDFDRNLRAALGVGETEFINVFAISPDKLQELGGLGLFSADELLNNGSAFVNYYGYDYTGKKLKKNPNFGDFFTDTLNRSVAPFAPFYAAGFIQDKFIFKDIIFNLGLRIDRYDANQKVLKDKYSLFDLQQAANVTTVNGNPVSHPSNIGSDFAVYVDDDFNPTKILGYRGGDQFYDAQGNQLSTGKTLEKGGRTHPLINAPLVNGQYVVTEAAFTDYKPQNNFNPRISFSFPISDVASFFANYDVLTSRPTTNSRTTALDYYFLVQNPTGSINNPNLMPEKNINYQLGFKQALSQSSALTVSAFYRDIRDQIQIQAIQYAYPNNYTTYENRDFGTVKGATLAYDLRRTKNVRLNISYTLQFANGTGSSSTSTANLTALNLPSILVPLPLNNDQRHTIVSTVDYRFGRGTNYDGPASLKSILEDMGANFIFRLGSGTPYSKQATPTSAADLGGGDTRTRTLAGGTINGSVLPSQFSIDFRLDKTIPMGSKSTSTLNVYTAITNLLNTKNISGVYNTTGSPSDDGWLSSMNGQQTTNEQIDPISYYQLYSAKVVNPGNYRLPRAIRLGVELSF